MFKFLKKKFSGKEADSEPQQQQQQQPENSYPPGEDWILVPFRFVETARVSIHTIGSQEEVPQAVRWWIAQWLNTFNDHLVQYMQDTYGPGIFQILDRITEDVMPKSPPPSSDSWYKWEMQLEGDHDD